MVRRTIIKETI